MLVQLFKFYFELRYILNNIFITADLVPVEENRRVESKIF